MLEKIMKYQKLIIQVIITLFLASLIWMCNISDNQRYINELSKKLQASVDSLIEIESEDVM
jgi:hypothetical protein